MKGTSLTRASRRVFLRRAALGLGGLTAISVLGCQAASPTSVPATSGPTATTAARRGGTLIMADQGGPASLDIHKESSTVVDLYGQFIYEGLVYRDGDAGRFLPYLAESWDTSADGLTWTFRLRRDVLFHDGTKLDARAVLRSYERIVDPATASKSAAARIGGKTLVGFDVPDEYSIRLKFSSPFGPLLDGLSSAFLGIISPAALDKYGDDIGSNPVGTGPFKLLEWLPKKHFSLVRNEQYAWGSSFFAHKGAPLLDEFRLLDLPEATTRIVALEAREAQVARLPLGLVKRAKEAGFEINVGATRGVPKTVYVNAAKSPTDDLKVRQAIALAVDRDALLAAPHLGGATFAEFAPLAKGTLGYDPAVATRAGYSYDPQRAKNLLDEAGWKEGADGVRTKGGAPLDLVILADFPGILPDTEAMQAVLRKVGIKATLLSLEGAAAVTALNKGEHHLHINSSSNPEPDVLRRLFHSAGIGVSSRSMANNARLDELLDTAATTVDVTKRVALYAEAQEIILREAYTVPLYNNARPYAFDSSIVKDLIVTDRGFPHPYQAWLDK